MTLNPLEEQIMAIFWKLGKAFPKEIVAYLDDPKPPYNTILSTIRKLEKDGMLSYKVFGKSHQYYPTISKTDFNKSLFKKIYHQYFGGSKTSLLSYFMEEENIDVNELKKLFKELEN
ncbi:MAG: BlaI/MecI/CopY family transcriptional regulator [Lewinellaceae bacterium]|nr:BlaI/MecI/CopY family transcriptional regulator [Lewinellaceae bacterium]